VFFPLNAAISRGIVRVVSKEAIPDWATRIPIMRKAGRRDKSGKVLNWSLWDGERQWRVGSLTAEQKGFSIVQIWNDTLLTERIAEGWSPELVDSEGTSVHTVQTSKQNGEEGTPNRLDPKSSPTFSHYLYFPTESGARNVAEALESDAFLVVVRPGADGVNWLVLASRSIPSSGSIEDERVKLEKLAESFEGEYDGWETSIADQTPRI